MLHRNRVIDVELDQLRKAKSVTSFVNSGNVGWVMDGDEINAITYGTDEVARYFGVVDALPCLLVMDAVPKQSFELLSLG